MADEVLSQNEIDSLIQAVGQGEVTATPAAQAGEQAGEQTEAPTDPGTDKRATRYDFHRPVMVSKEQIRTLQMIHDTFARGLATALSGHLRMNTEMKIVGVDQISYREFVLSIPDPCTIAIVRFKPSEGRTVLAMHPALGFAFVDRLMGGAGNALQMGRPFTEVEQEMINEIIDLALRELKTAWGRISNASFVVESTESSPQFVQIVTPEDTVIVVTLEISVAEVTGVMSLCYPFRSLDFVADRLSARYYVAEEQRAAMEKSRDLIQESVVHVPLTVAAMLGSASIKLNDLLRLKAGDVLLLDHRIEEPIQLKVGGRDHCRGFMGKIHGKRAVTVVERVTKD